MNSHTFAVDGMSCRSCELTIERKLNGVGGVRAVEASSAKGEVRVACDGAAPSLDALNAALAGEPYVLRRPDAPSTAKRPSFSQIAGAFATVFLFGWLLSKFGLLKTDFAVDGSGGFWPVFTIGLLAAASSCIAVSGGLLLSSSANYNRRYGSMDGVARMTPVFMFIAGRVLSYAFFGGLIASLGRILSPSPVFTGAIIVLAAAYMLIMGLDMLKLAPSWLKAVQPRMPKAIARRVVDAEGREHPAMPFALGALTFFIPCGFTQALQIYALTVGSFAQGGLVLAAFALGTAPSLLALGWASTSLKGKTGEKFFRFAGALVVVLGFWNLQNGMTALGYPLRLPDVAPATAAQTARDPNVRVVDGVQVIRMRLGSSPAYLPSDAYTIKAGMPVRMEIEGIGTGCRGELVVPKARVSVALTKKLNILEFTPKKPGDYVFSCAMGMFPGIMRAI
ncbi:MAG TPA: sulfite exporter TauE/SafE family protein [Patescibacteria group bacterium]|nr:sulfite exporter TauE/SafE family protein [Patescibacteria group bacterium]